MIGGTFRQSLGLGPLLAPCTYALHAQQLISLRQFRPNTSTTRTVTRAASTLQPTKHRKQEPEGQWAGEFRSLGLSPELLVATQEHGLTQPTEIQVIFKLCMTSYRSHCTSLKQCCCETYCLALQAAAIPDMLQGGDVLLASHTGSGKTLAYLLPLVWNLRNLPFWAGSRTNLHYALADAAQALYTLCCCTIACFSSAVVCPLCCCCTMQPAGSLHWHKWWAESCKVLLLLLLQVHKLRQQEQDGQQTKPRRPRALVLGPTRELTDQILQVAKSLSHHARFRSACVNGGNALSFQRTMHVLVADHGVGLLHNGA